MADEPKKKGDRKSLRVATEVETTIARLIIETRAAYSSLGREISDEYAREIVLSGIDDVLPAYIRNQLGKSWKLDIPPITDDPSVED